MPFGLEAKHWRLIQELLVEPLKAQGAEVWIFGSRALGTHKKYSDIDILFKPSRPLPPAFVSEMRESLEESSLPYKVDLVHEPDLAESYRENVMRQRKSL